MPLKHTSHDILESPQYSRINWSLAGILIPEYVTVSVPSPPPPVEVGASYKHAPLLLTCEFVIHSAQMAEIHVGQRTTANRVSGRKGVKVVPPGGNLLVGPVYRTVPSHSRPVQATAMLPLLHLCPVYPSPSRLGKGTRPVDGTRTRPVDGTESWRCLPFQESHAMV